MTDNEMRIVIAEKCGWEKVHINSTIGVCGYEPNTPKLNWTCVPNYPNDLNAIHAEVRQFNLPTLQKFSNHLKAIVEDRLCVTSAVDARYMTLQADAPWWCEAFIKTVCPEK